VSERIKNLNDDEILVQVDFAENYAYVAQDAAQAFHYNRSMHSNSSLLLLQIWK